MELNELRKTAEAATPGPWDLYSTQDYEVFCATNFTDSNYDPPAVTYGSDRSEDAEFIATFNPETALALLSSLEQAEESARLVDDMLRAVLEAFGSGPETDPIIKARQIVARLEQAEQAVQRVREMSAHRKEIRLDYVDLIDLDRAVDGDGRG